MTHVLRRQELPLLDVDGFAGSRGGDEQVGLPGEKRRNLQHVDDVGGRGGLRRLVNVGQQRQSRSARARRRGRVVPHRGPGPRNDVMEVRFALSKDALKMTGTPQRVAISRMAAAVSSACAALSMTHGPRMKASGLPAADREGPDPDRLHGPYSIDFARAPDVRRVQLDRSCGDSRFDEARKQRMRPERLRLELGMELHGDEPRMRRQLRDLDELAVRRAARHASSRARASAGS